MEFADTPDYIALRTADMLRMRAQGKSNDQMMFWLRTHGVDANLEDVDTWWQNYDKKQKEKQQHRPAVAAPDSARNPNPHESASSAKNRSLPAEKECLPMASGGLTTPVHARQQVGRATDWASRDQGVQQHLRQKPS